MKKEKALSIMEHIDPDIIDEADAYKETKKKSTWVKWGAMAACLCLVVAGAFGANNLFKNRDIVMDDPVGTNKVISGNPSISENQGPAIGNSGLYIPPVELPNTTAGVASDMIGLVVYKGGIYTQAEGYYGADALHIDKLVGKYLGYATGSINEWSKQEEYAEEFASSVAGKVYEVIGYDTSFRICVRMEFEDENGGKQLFIEFLDRLNGITLTNGADLFENRLRISNRISTIQWQSHNDWDNNLGNIQNAVLDTELWEKFLDQINKGTFVNTWNPEISSNTIYNTEKQSHIILTMEDGTVIRLRLIEGGYVGYDALGGYFVQIPRDVFDSVFSACGGNN